MFSGMASESSSEMFSRSGRFQRPLNCFKEIHQVVHHEQTPCSESATGERYFVCCLNLLKQKKL